MRLGSQEEDKETRMPQVSVGAEPVQIAGGMERPVIKNLGPGNLGIDTTDQVTVATASIHLAPNESYEFPVDVYQSGWPRMYAVADAASTDVRIAEVG